MKSLIKCYLMKTHARKRVFQHKYFYKHLLKVFKWKNQIRNEIRSKREQRQQLRQQHQQMQLQQQQQQQQRQHSQTSHLMKFKIEPEQQRLDITGIEPQLSSRQQLTIDTKISQKHTDQHMNCFSSRNQINNDCNHNYNAKHDTVQPIAKISTTANSIGATVTPPSSTSSPFDPTTTQFDSSSSMVGTPCSNASNSNPMILMQPSSGSSNCFSNRGSPSDSNESETCCASLSQGSSSNQSSQPWGELMSPRPYHQAYSQPSAIASVLHESAAAAKAAAANGQQPMANVDIIRRNLWLMIVKKEILPAHRRRMNFRTEKLHKTRLAAHRCLSHLNLTFRKLNQKSYNYHHQLTSIKQKAGNQISEDHVNHSIPTTISSDLSDKQQHHSTSTAAQSQLSQ